MRNEREQLAHKQLMAGAQNAQPGLWQQVDESAALPEHFLSSGNRAGGSAGGPGEAVAAGAAEQLPLRAGEPPAAAAHRGDSAGAGEAGGAGHWVLPGATPKTVWAS
jgi:hypothetical protein